MEKSMNFRNKIIIFASLMLLFSEIEANVDVARKNYSEAAKSNYPKVVSELMLDGLFFAAVPLVKEYLSISGKINDASVDRMLDELIVQVGVRQFEVLPVKILENSNSPIIRYILAKKAFRSSKKQNSSEQVIKYIDKYIPDTHPIKPFTLMLEASAYSIDKKEERAIVLFNECFRVANQQMNQIENKNRRKQLMIARDYCQVGISRAQFSSKKYDLANLSYLDLPKSSYIWPEVLFEEAWNSFYLKDYNRTLGKLVTYKAPVFNYIFNPEIEVLKALTYMDMCLWDDTRKVVEGFYAVYENAGVEFKRMLDAYGSDYRQYYLLVKGGGGNRVAENNIILNSALLSIMKDPVFLDLFSDFQKGQDEIRKVKLLPSDQFKSILIENLKESLGLQRNLIGGYVRSQLHLFYSQINRTFEDMSYIKLEVLSKKKTELYDDISLTKESRKRGDVSYIKRDDKQYFWTFNGEFWADELGDYVFSLKSECK